MNRHSWPVPERAPAFTTGRQYTPHGRAERVISTGRVVLGASSLLAIWVDPSQPAKYEALTYTLMAVYVAYAGVLAAIAWSARVPWPWLPSVTHALDLVAFSLFIFLTDGPPTSPFFVYFIFSILCATLRWGWRATLWTSLVSVTVFLAMGVLGGNVLDAERFNRFIIRSVYLSVVAVMLGYLGAYEQQLRGEIAKLADWPRVSGDARDAVRVALAYAAAVMGAPRAVIVWEESEEPWVHVGAWSAGEMTWSREGPGALDPLVAPALGGHAFLCSDAAATAPAVFHRAGAGGLGTWCGVPVRAAFRERFGIRRVIAAALSGEAIQGWLLFLETKRLTSDDLTLAEIVAQQVAAALEHSSLLRRLQQTAVMEERIRLARDLHDGLLQSLTGMALQLHALRSSLLAEPREALDRLGELQALLVTEQQSLRLFIRELRPEALLPLENASNLAASLRNLAHRIERHWGVRVSLAVAHLESHAVEAAGYDIAHMVHEALVNAARHGGATSARVEVAARDGQVIIVVADNGRGFSFRGRHDLAALGRMGAGPATLRERVTALGGTLTIESDSSGARLEIGLPLARATG